MKVTLPLLGECEVTATAVTIGDVIFSHSDEPKMRKFLRSWYHGQETGHRVKWRTALKEIRKAKMGLGIESTNPTRDNQRERLERIAAHCDIVATQGKNKGKPSYAALIRRLSEVHEENWDALKEVLE